MFSCGVDRKIDGTHTHKHTYTHTLSSQAFPQQHLFPDKKIQRLSGPANGIISTINGDDAHLIHCLCALLVCAPVGVNVCPASL